MDTKSKSRHSLGIIIIMIVVLLTSAATVGLYPYLVERMRPSARIITSTTCRTTWRFR